MSGAVSYTHLDVYKRQAKRGGDAQGHAGLFLKPHIDDDGQRHQHREGRAHTDHHPREVEAVDGAVGAHEEHAQVLQQQRQRDD